MADNDSNPTPQAGQLRWFPPTRWTDILACREAASPQAAAALDRLCAAYWYPLYAYIRRRGRSDEDAQDLTQSFFEHLLQRDLFSTADRSRGKFRSFLLASLNYFLSNQREFAQAKKRGGGIAFVCLDDKTPDERYSLEPTTDLSPEKLFERHWALTILERTQTQLQADYQSQGKADLFRQLRPFLSDETGSGDYAHVATALGMTPGAVATAVHRLRHRYAEMLDAEIAQTVGSPEEVEKERNYLYRALSRD